MKKLFHPFILRGLIGLCGALMLNISGAQVNILVATTQEGSAGTPLHNNVYTEFTSDSAWNVTDARNTLGALSTAPTPSFAGFDVVVIAATYYSLQPDELAALQNAIDNRLSTSFVLFFDGCCGNGSSGSSVNIDNLVSVLNNSFATPVTASSGTFLAPAVSYEVTNSPLATGFPMVIQGAAYSPFIGIPEGNVIYKQADNAAGFILPVTESVGACVFGLADASPFDNIRYPVNRGTIAPAFINAATNPQGACFLRSTPVPSKVPFTKAWALMLLVAAFLGLVFRHRFTKDIKGL